MYGKIGEIAARGEPRSVGRPCRARSRAAETVCAERQLQAQDEAGKTGRAVQKRSL
jgi:hypothetical protein